MKKYTHTLEIATQVENQNQNKKFKVTSQSHHDDLGTTTRQFRLYQI